LIIIDEGRNRVNYNEEFKLALIELKTKYDRLIINLVVGVDDVRQHCINLRNKVDLQTEKNIEELHQINESLLSEITLYENACVDSFNSNIVHFSNYCSRILEETKQFLDSNAQYFCQLKEDGHVSDGSILQVRDLIERLGYEEVSLRKITFNKKVMEFEPIQSYAKLGDVKFNFLEFNHKDLVKEYGPYFDLFNNDKGEFTLIYCDSNRNLCLELLDKNGNEIRRVSDLIKTRSISSTLNQLHNYVIGASLEPDTHSLFNHTLSQQDTDSWLLLVLDGEFSYMRHRPIDYQIQWITANSSILLCIDIIGGFHFYDLNLNIVKDISWNVIQNSVDSRSIDCIIMNDIYLFILSNKKKLKIFELSTLNLKKELYIEADMMKLVSTRYLILYNAFTKVVYLFNQSGDFEIVKTVKIGNSFDRDLPWLNVDNSPTISFYNETSLRHINFDQIFEL
jgi:hypothetical protein